MTRILAIDQSTSGTKAIVFDRAGAVIEKASVEHRQLYPRPGWVEHDAEEIWRNTLEVLGRVRLEGVGQLSLTNQRETVVVFDRATGRPLHNAIVWQCRRGAELCASLLRAGHGPMVTAKTGLKIDPYFSASKIAWLMRYRPDVAAAVRGGSAIIGTIDAYLIHRLTGGRVCATDHTNASRTLLFDIGRLRWDEELCDLFGVPPSALPEVRDSTAGFGRVELPGMGTVPIFGVMGDSQAALFAQRCFAPGGAKVTIGTGSSVLLNVGGTVRAGGDAGVATIAWTHAGRATYCLEGIINYAAATIEWLRNQLELIEDPAETEAIASSVPDAGGVYLVPAFVGLSAPHWSLEARGAIVGLSPGSGKAHVVRAALESIAYQVHDVLDAMRRSGGIELGSIQADGGATRNRLLMQFIADMCGVSIVAADVPECSALGAALAGGLGSGIYKSLDELSRLPRAQTVYAPRMAPARREELLTGWRRAVRQVVRGAEA